MNSEPKSQNHLKNVPVYLRTDRLVGRLVMNRGVEKITFDIQCVSDVCLNCTWKNFLLLKLEQE